MITDKRLELSLTCVWAKLFSTASALHRAHLKMHMAAFPATPNSYATMLAIGPICPCDLGHFQELGKNQAPAYSVSDKGP